MREISRTTTGGIPEPYPSPLAGEARWGELRKPEQPFLLPHLSSQRHPPLPQPLPQGEGSFRGTPEPYPSARRGKDVPAFFKPHHNQEAAL